MFLWIRAIRRCSLPQVWHAGLRLIKALAVAGMGGDNGMVSEG